ncbi:hypothetical protein [Streptomyces sp. G1]|uniref:hypothetical protein n=1 Tax=Streptomyces sp. G1 TaxID=361572 RepID=UPI002030A804|nr:hypothetical protein [Streptomyces sp. G1]MCM1964823.1 hypothetical protein [Streptomyces sp. G1]
MDFYYRFPATGAVQIRSLTGTFDPEDVYPPEGAVEITPTEYATELAAIQVQTELRRAAMFAEDAARKLTDYTALVALGLPVATALRLSGHVPEEPDLPDLPGLPLVDGGPS